MIYYVRFFILPLLFVGSLCSSVGALRKKLVIQFHKEMNNALKKGDKRAARSLYKQVADQELPAYITAIAGKEIELDWQIINLIHQDIMKLKMAFFLPAASQQFSDWFSQKFFGMESAEPLLGYQLLAVERLNDLDSDMYDHLQGVETEKSSQELVAMGSKAIRLCGIVGCSARLISTTQRTMDQLQQMIKDTDSSASAG